MDEDAFDPERFRLAPEQQSALGAAKPKAEPKQRQKYAYVPLPWGYQAMTIAGRGAAIVVHALHVQKTKGRGDVPITAAVLKKCGLDHRMRTRTIDRLLKAGFATVRRRGKQSQGCPLLTMLLPEQGSGSNTD